MVAVEMSHNHIFYWRMTAILCVLIHLSKMDRRGCYVRLISLCRWRINASIESDIPSQVFVDLIVRMNCLIVYTNFVLFDFGSLRSTCVWFLQIENRQFRCWVWVQKLTRTEICISLVNNIRK